MTVVFDATTAVVLLQLGTRLLSPRPFAFPPEPGPRSEPGRESARVAHVQLNTGPLPLVGMSMTVPPRNLTPGYGPPPSVKVPLMTPVSGRADVFGCPQAVRPSVAEATKAKPRR